MYIKQLSVFIENKEGTLEDVLDILKANNINIISLSLADTADYGMLRLIVSEADKAKSALKSKGFSVMLTDVVVVKLSHTIGKLQEITAILVKANINVEYMYSLSIGKDDACIVFKPSTAIEDVADQIKADGIEIVSQTEIDEMAM